MRWVRWAETQYSQDPYRRIIIIAEVLPKE